MVQESAPLLLMKPMSTQLLTGSFLCPASCIASACCGLVDCKSPVSLDLILAVEGPHPQRGPPLTETTNRTSPVRLHPKIGFALLTVFIVFFLFILIIFCFVYLEERILLLSHFVVWIDRRVEFA